MSPEAASLTMQLIWLGWCFGLGYVTRRRAWLWCGIPLGVFATIVGPFMTEGEGGGPGGCVSLFALPAFCALSIRIGQAIAESRRPMKERR